MRNDPARIPDLLNSARFAREGSELFEVESEKVLFEHLT
jgi:hypothetical protein